MAMQRFLLVLYQEPVPMLVRCSLACSALSFPGGGQCESFQVLPLLSKIEQGKGGWRGREAGKKGSNSRVK